MFRASLCPSSGEQECALPHVVFCTGSDGCGCVELGRELCAHRLVASCWFLSLQPTQFDILCSTVHITRYGGLVWALANTQFIFIGMPLFSKWDSSEGIVTGQRGRLLRNLPSIPCKDNSFISLP